MVANNVKVILCDRDNDLQIDVDVLIGLHNKINPKKEDKIKESATNLNSEEMVKLVKALYHTFTDKQLPLCFIKDALDFNEQEIELISLFKFIKENGGLENEKYFN